jgi:helix-turn-helix protein
MSWLIEQYIRDMPYILETHDFESDAYNNVLLLQRHIKNLDRQGLLSEEEKLILEAVFEGYNYTEISKLLKMDRQTVSETFKNVTDRLAYIMGSMFTDASFLDRIQTTEDLGRLDISEIFKRGTLKNE